MVSEDKKVTAPVGLPEVANLLGTSVDIGKVCTSDNINKWSRIKPVPYPSLFIGISDEGWYHGKKEGVDLVFGMNYGASETYPFAAADVNSIEEPGKVRLTGNGMFVSMANGTAGNWDYNKPSGGIKEPYRLCDFDLYAHNAVNPLPHVVSGIVNHRSTSGSNASGQFKCLVPTQVEGGITLEELGVYDLNVNTANGTPFSEMYLGVFAFNDSMSDCIWVTQEDKFGERKNNNVSFATTEISPICKIKDKKGLYHCVTFFSSVPLTLCQTEFSTSTYCVPCNNERFDIALLPEGTPDTYITIKDFKILSGTQFSVTAYAANWNVYDQTISSVVFVAVGDIDTDVQEYVLHTDKKILAFSEMSVGGDVKEPMLYTKGYIKMTINGTVYTSETINRKDKT